MIFAAGLGTRLKPFTDRHPKALVEVGGKPMLAHVIERMKLAGIRQIVVNVHHFADQIVDFIARNRNFDIEIIISDETHRLLDTGGGLLKAETYLRDADAILVHNADVMTNLNLQRLIDYHLVCRPTATLSVSFRNSSRLLYFDVDNRLQGWQNLNTGETQPGGFEILPQYRGLAFSGVQVVSPLIFPKLREYAAGLTAVCDHDTDEAIISETFRRNEVAFSITPFYLSICREYAILGNVMPEETKWFDVGRPESLAKASLAFS